MSRFKPMNADAPWRRFLTANEARAIEAADAAKVEWKRLWAERDAIIKRAAARARADGPPQIQTPKDARHGR